MGKNRPFGVHTISNIYPPNVTAQYRGNMWVRGVAEPYSGNKLIAAWWVLTGRAQAIVWPKVGDLEKQVQPND